MYRLKIAVSVFYLRTKPDSLNGEDYAKKICDQFSASQLQWKEKLAKNEVQMLHLKQELFLCKQRQTNNEEIADFSNSQVLFPTPPPSANPDRNDFAHVETSEPSSSLAKHVTFLQKVMTLQIGAKLINDKKLENLVHASLLHSMDLLNEMHDRNQFISKLQMQCVNCLDNLIQKVNPQIRSELVDKTGVIVAEIVEKLASRLKLDNKTRQGKAEIIIQLGNNPFFLEKVLEQLTAAVSRVSGHLRDTLANKTTLDPVLYSNIYVILDTMDKCMSCKQVSALDKESKVRIQQQLEDSVTFLTDVFPLYTMAIWRLCCKIL